MRPYDGAALECKGEVNGSNPRKYAGKRHRPARFPHARIRERTRQGSGPDCLAYGSLTSYAYSKVQTYKGRASVSLSRTLAKVMAIDISTTVYVQFALGVQLCQLACRERHQHDIVDSSGTAPGIQSYITNTAEFNRPKSFLTSQRTGGRVGGWLEKNARGVATQSERRTHKHRATRTAAALTRRAHVWCGPAAARGDTVATRPP
ncbi:hypothetical protein PR048_027666 [Dryococelus australis]|uniref:Uncharacterized protein n=1 Tax=Dryococelus australis TaxID=614101 RepID=A0ABQ9GH45_9NEOP|nr:hypothetical protein PR048_027666 [Dryococelus australis]